MKKTKLTEKLSRIPDISELKKIENESIRKI